MSLPSGMSTGAAAAPAFAADPFGLWQAPGGSVSFGGVGQNSTDAEPPAAVWSLDLTGGADQQLAVRERQVRAIERGLEQASERLDALLSAREAARARPGGLSFGVSEHAAELDTPELFLAQALDQIEPPGEAVSFGLREDLSNLAGRVRDGVAEAKKLAGTDWETLRARLEALFDGVNRQLLHYVWVDTSLEGALSARTVIDWAGDLSTCCRPELTADQLAAHQRSLQLAMTSRSANLNTVITVARLAAKITLAVTTPLGPVQALALAWEFVNSIVLPMVQGPSSH